MSSWRGAGAVLLLLAGLAGLAACSHETDPVLSASVSPIFVVGKPQAIIPGPRLNTVLVSCVDNQSVVEVDTSTLRCRQAFQVRSGPGPLISDPVHQCVYCLHLRENVMSLICGKPLTDIRHLSTGDISLAGGALRPGHNELWVSDGTTGLHILVPPGMAIKDKWLVGRFPQRVAFTPDGAYAWVVLKGENAVVILDIAKHSEIARVPVGIYPQDIVLAGDTACVSNFGSNDVSLISLTGRQERARVKVRNKPNGLAVRGAALWVSCEDSYRLVAIDVAKAKVIGTVKTGFYPGAIAALPDGRLAVADARHKRIALITLSDSTKALFAPASPGN